MDEKLTMCGGVTVGNGGLEMVLGCNWVNMSARFFKATLVSVPMLANEAARPELRKKWERSAAVSLTMLADNVSGIVTRCGKNSTVSLVRIPLVLGMYTE